MLTYCSILYHFPALLEMTPSFVGFPGLRPLFYNFFRIPRKYSKGVITMNETKKLYRIPSQGMIAGVCAGLAEYLNADPTIIRLVFAFLALTGTAGIWIYLIMMLIVPVQQDSE